MPDSCGVRETVTTVLEEADAVTRGDRNKDYGSPLGNHSNVAAYWRLWVERKYGIVVPFDAEDVCWMNILQKVSREGNARKRDNLVDVAGYVRNVEMVQDEAHENSVAVVTFGPLTRGDEKSAAG